MSIIDRAHFHGLLDGGGSDPGRVLIVGGGAAGASAALRARERGVVTTLVEARDYLFHRQQASDRVVDPTTYDWPAPHWIDGVIGELPLPYQGKAAKVLAREWWQVFQKQVVADPLLFLRFGTRLINTSPSSSGGGGSRLAADFQVTEIDPATGRRTESASTEEFDFILHCTGPGEETVALENGASHGHASFPFWIDDQLEAQGFNLPPGHPARDAPRILISGGGDGSLQDFLHIVFPRWTPRRIYEHLLPDPVLRTEIERDIFAAEDAFRRAWIWAEDPEFDCQVLQQLHNQHLDAVDKAAGQVPPAAITAIPGVARARSVRIAHSCNHFSLCYALNHFLALLVDRVLGGGHFLPQSRLIEIKSAADPAIHTCSGSAAYCWEHPHNAARLSTVTCMSASDASTVPPLPFSDTLEYDLIVLRHGPKSGTPKLNRQILPYRLPWKPAATPRHLR